MLPEQVGDWVLHELPRLNEAILNQHAPPELLVTELCEHVLPGLPDPTQLTPVQAQRLVVHLGFAGASVARHYQEHTPGGTEHPERAFDVLTAGEERIPFRRYFAGLAQHTGTGHYDRDSYASLVRWNVGTVRVRLHGEVVAELPGVFDDGRIRSYTGTAGEERFFLLVKQGEAIELAVNCALEPLTAEHASLICEKARHRVREATVLLAELRRLFRDFASRPAEETMAADAFMDVFRQFAAHWTPGDIPPSGALDPEALKRDFLLGIDEPEYDRQARRLFPALLDQERTEIGNLMSDCPLPCRVLAEVGVDEADLRLSDEGDLRRLVAHHPALIDWHRLLTMHAQVSGAHLMLSKKFLFKPQRQRDAAGLGDQHLVSNRAGTTGMTETYLERLTRARQRHTLAALRPVLIPENRDPGADPAVRSDRGAAAPVVLELTG
ncbi:hypothetical protein ACWT_2046 [Actinoplanes sp. SE50]|uniref:hypothetical protein n=1 Tax=unclassified Actinoplanes TaxID=2626549 RepID=UPI00023EC5B0|nr:MULTISPECIES: hypothetical protein [unclassified Actinoplanes]AEV83065.1 hypothetical protein ACPL_2168 [Actinoplanes sp. SE50/110]ATO81461.1 hypothetical protein ACWT_2046 [Actinoplanes sp. SE50]SLL98868.1 hypothetical protein ACSP50_2095 [Actinoplanes sp. SE50/110]